MEWLVYIVKMSHLSPLATNLLPMSAPAPRKHTKYYFDDGNVIFLTSDRTLFRLHKSILRLHSTFFDDMFENAHPPTKNEKGEEIPVDGSSDDWPIELGGHSLATLRDSEMETMCEVLYEMPLTPASELKIDQAVTLLRVAAKFQFESIQSRIIERLDGASISPAKRYAFAIDCLVDEWIPRSYLEICVAVDSASAELCAEFSQRAETSKLSAVLLVREDYRGKLLIYVHGNQSHPYTSSQNSPSLVCGSCLPGIKQLLLRILTTGGVADLDGAEPSEFLSIEQRLLKGIQPKSNSQTPISICAACRQKEKAIVSQVLGIDDLKNEVRKVMHLP
ncbi:unnamed protein product [Rhizoctonia solani]|uniref:BTB domain-containing protein n=1 Tax=Rhizoctonia solani TaxID=456999 RepID=A0A8H3I3V9_9AGAM|nr:unnamed protein product [Rhizoctonia solani]